MICCKLTNWFSITILIGALMLVSCTPSAKELSPEQITAVKDSVQQMAVSIEHDVSKDGVIAWLKYFEDAPGFFMASNGQMAFADHRSADTLIRNNLVKSIRRINLKWNALRIDALSPDLASVAANFHEDITDSTGKTIAVAGYFTGIARQTTKGWQLHNAHWSIKTGG